MPLPFRLRALGPTLATRAWITRAADPAVGTVRIRGMLVTAEPCTPMRSRLRGRLCVEGMSPHPSEIGALAQELLVRIARRDREAFVALFSLTAPRVKTYLLRLGCAPAAAEELTQDVMLTVWRKAEQFDSAKAGALTWIFVIARNRRIDAIRRERSTLTYGAHPPETPDETTPLASDVVAGAERDQIVRAALEGLSPEQRDVIQRSFFDEQPHSEIADALDLPLGTVKSRLRLAMAKLRLRLGDLA